MMKRFRILNLILSCLVIFALSSCSLFGSGDNDDDDTELKTLFSIDLFNQEVRTTVSNNFNELSSLTLDLERVLPTSGTEVTELTILTVNDFHGALEATDGENGIARLGAALLAEMNANPDETILLAAGDMFQGTGLSNYRYGQDLINIMNSLGFDAMCIGNHEFDWGLETITDYFDEDVTNGEANFPILGANIKQKSTNSLPEYVEPYTIIERGGLTIGIIGYMGYGLESDIASDRVADYEFIDPTTLIGTLSAKLRTEEDCDIVIAMGHDADESTNNSIGTLVGNQKIDAIINAHTHNVYHRTIPNSEQDVPVIQAGSSGEYYGVIELSLSSAKTVIGATAETVYVGSGTENALISEYVSKIANATAPIFGLNLGTAGSYISASNVRTWAADQVMTYVGADYAVVNSGGIRNNAFPISINSNITYGKVYEIMPFDNYIYVCTLKGADLKKVAKSSGLVNSSNVTFSGSNVFLNGKLVVDDTDYLVATIDYVATHPDYDIAGNCFNINYTAVLYRDVLAYYIAQESLNDGAWLS